MPSPEILTRAIALGTEPRGDRFIAYRLLSKERGAITVLVRRSSKPGRQPIIDLFDYGEFRIEIKPGSYSGFLKEAHVHRKRLQLAKSYKAFEFAARLAKTILSNPSHDENFNDIFQILEKGLDAWEEGKDASATYLKCLYLYCRQEGYPVKEEWAASLPPDDFRFIVALLNQPLEANTSDQGALENSIERLEFYVAHHTHIRLGH